MARTAFEAPKRIGRAHVTRGRAPRIGSAPSSHRPLTGAEFEYGSDGSTPEPLDRESIKATEVPKWKRKETARLKKEAKDKEAREAREAQEARQAQKAREAEKKRARVENGDESESEGEAESEDEEWSNSDTRPPATLKRKRNNRKAQRSSKRAALAARALGLEDVNTRTAATDALYYASGDDEGLEIDKEVETDEGEEADEGIEADGEDDGESLFIRSGATAPRSTANSAKKPDTAQPNLTQAQARHELFLKIRKSSDLAKLAIYASGCVNELEKKLAKLDDAQREYFAVIHSSALVFAEIVKSTHAADYKFNPQSVRKQVAAALGFENAFKAIDELKRRVDTIERLPRLIDLIQDRLAASEARVSKWTHSRPTRGQFWAETSRASLQYLLAMVKEKQMFRATRKTATKRTSTDKAKMRFLYNIAHVADHGAVITELERSAGELAEKTTHALVQDVPSAKVLHHLCLAMLEWSKAAQAVKLLAASPSTKLFDIESQLCYSVATKAVETLETSVATIENLTRLDKRATTLLSGVKKELGNEKRPARLAALDAWRDGLSFVLALVDHREDREEQEKSTVAQEPAIEQT